jgi:hypothetical protein
MGIEMATTNRNAKSHVLNETISGHAIMHLAATVVRPGISPSSRRLIPGILAGAMV